MHESALAMLEDSEMSKGFWPEAHEYANYVRNHSPTKALSHMTLNEAFYGKKPSIATLRVFGLHCHIRVPPEQCQKLDAHSADGILCGFEHVSKAYKVWIPSRHKFIASCDVIVHERTLDQSDLEDPNPSPTTPSEGVPTPTTAPIEGVMTGNNNQTSTQDTTTVTVTEEDSTPYPPSDTNPRAAQPAPTPS